ncbi:MAG: DUF1801 domain-containing protein [Crocinitomicaceae bacterium]
MEITNQITDYISSFTEPKQSDLRTLHNLILEIKPNSKLWFLDGKNAEGKIVSNPNIGYGNHTLHYANGKTREFYRIGLSANTTGVSVYIMGIEDKNYLPQTFGKIIGKTSVTSYCIKFKSLKDVNLAILKTAIRNGFEDFI